MSLRNIRVYENWEERALLAEREAATRWRLAFIAVLLALPLALAARSLLLDPTSDTFVADGVASSLYLVTGIIAVAHLSTIRMLFVAFLYIPLVLGIFLSDFASRVLPGSTDSPSATVLYLLTLSVTLVLPGASIIGWALFKNARDNIRGLAWVEWANRILFGLVGGSAVALVQFLSPLLSNIPMSYSIPGWASSLQYVFYVIGLRSVSEELVFRGIIYRRLYQQRRMGFWAATLITLPLNLALYVLLMSPADPPGVKAVGLLGPCLMVIVNCALYTWEGGLIAPTVSNVVFQIFSFLSGMR